MAEQIKENTNDKIKMKLTKREREREWKERKWTSICEWENESERREKVRQNETITGIRHTMKAKVDNVHSNKIDQ